MMFSGSKAAHGLNIFKWKWRGESSLSTGLLDHVPPEIELSDYHRAPSPSSESPSGLLNDESFKVEHISDLDLFFERLYCYYCEKGLWCIIIKWVFELFGLAFTICFSGFFLLFVDWSGLRSAKCGMDAVESGIKPCDLSKEALHHHPLSPFTISKAIVVGYLGIFSIYWIFCFLRFFAQLKDTLIIRDFYYNSLHVTDDEIQTMPWPSILDKIVESQNSQQLCVSRDLSIQDVVMRLMRKENYLIGMVNKGVLAFPISPWVPGVGPVKFCVDGVQHRLILTKTLEWTLNWCILQTMFDKNYCVRKDFVSDPKTLKKRLMIVGIAMFLVSPFLVIFMLVYLFLRHAEQFYNHPSTASSRRWSTLAKWIFREYNEVDHLFKHRMNTSIVHASDYLKQFPSPIISLIAKFISFVSGGFAAVLIIIAFLDESLLEGHIFGRNLLWYGAVFGAITAISRAAVTDELLVHNPHEAMSLAVQHTHYMPKRWRGKENTDGVRSEFETLFQYTGMMLLEEMVSIFLTPYLLLFVVPKRVDDVLQFITDFTVDVEGVGNVCSFSVFDFRNHGNSKYGSPFNTPRTRRSSQGKMEKSFLSFHNSYPSLEPNADGKQFLLTLRAFREQGLYGHEMMRRGPYPPINFHPPWNLIMRGSSGDRNGYFPPTNNLRDGGFPYILDHYYTLHTANSLSDAQPDHFEVGPEDVWAGPVYAQNEFDDRTRSYLYTSTSAPLIRESVLHHQHHQDYDDAEPSVVRQDWWARSRPQVLGPQTSFLEPPTSERGGGGPQTSFLEPPPTFNHPNPHNYYVNFSDRSAEDEQENLDLRSGSNRVMTGTFFMEESVGEFNLPFDDIYRRRSASPSQSMDPAGFV
ncbi:unnamed protein product [Cuscuta epithymum]|uniref:Autophagy-related protein 9 n=1 Tax=Cuscuta epithymum TaxID=186058 RepID=A0AAV0FSA8_9ASTE|nr:unnamed protein product [Cuscuta epithymum]CAH9138266.1 unnamed protein product [Cuscuta epithymum]